MNRKLWILFGALCALTMSTVGAAPAVAQTAEVKEKAPMYSYVSDWTIPRAHWAEMEKSAGANQGILDKAIASGTLVAYGNDENLVHQADGPTHDSWWSAMSMAGLVNVLDQFSASGSSTSSVLASSTKHWDTIFVSRYYSWRPGTYKNAYTHGSSYKLKADAPDDAVDTISKSLMVPLMEKMMASGAIVEYEIDTHAIHSEAPGTFWLFYITPNAEGLDKVNEGLREALKASPLSGPAFGSMVDFTPHRDELLRTNATYK